MCVYVHVRLFGAAAVGSSTHRGAVHLQVQHFGEGIQLLVSVQVQSFQAGEGVKGSLDCGDLVEGQVQCRDLAQVTDLAQHRIQAAHILQPIVMQLDDEGRRLGVLTVISHQQPAHFFPVFGHDFCMFFKWRGVNFRNVRDLAVLPHLASL